MGESHCRRPFFWRHVRKVDILESDILIVLDLGLLLVSLKSIHVDCGERRGLEGSRGGAYMKVPGDSGVKYPGPVFPHSTDANYPLKTWCLI